MDFYSAFTKYLTEEKGYLNNTTGKYFRIIKVFLNEATERGINNQLDFRSKKFKALKEDTDQIYLNEDELRQFYKLDLTENIRLEKIRDLFLIGCYTGLRFSDFSNLNESNIDFDRNTIKVKTQKTGQLVTIPLRPTVLDIFKKYNNSIPPAISNQKMNLYLKELGKKAEMFSLISISKAAGKNVSKNIYKKFELITTHTARRSFASNAYLAGVPTISIMKLTGHKTEKAFMQYIRITQEENALMMLEHSHFKS